MISSILVLCLLLAVFLAVSAEVIAISAWLVLDTTYSSYTSDTADCNDAMKGALASKMGMATSNITTFTPADSSGSARVDWVASVTTTQFGFSDVETALVDGQVDGTLANAIQIAANLNGATPLASATVSSISVTSTEPTQAPTAGPTAAPTALTPEHFNWLLEEHYIFVSILGSIIGVFVLYWLTWGGIYFMQWYNELQERQEREIQGKLEKANEKLARKFHNHIDNPAPHASRMRENFRRQFGKDAASPESAMMGTGSSAGGKEEFDSDDEEKGGGGGVALTKVQVGMSTPRGGAAVAKAPGSAGYMDGGIYSGIRRPGVQAKPASGKKDDAASPKRGGAKLDLSAHARAPSILSPGSRQDEGINSGSKQSARFKQGGGDSKQFGFTASPASPAKR